MSFSREQPPFPAPFLFPGFLLLAFRSPFLHVGETGADELVYVLRAVEHLAADGEVRQHPDGTVALQRADAHLQQQAQVLVVQHLLAVERVVLLQHPFQQFLRPVEAFHDALHPALKLFPVRVHSSRPPFR